MPFLRLVKHSPEVCLALLPGGFPELESRGSEIMSQRELAEGRVKTSASARRDWLLGRLAAKGAAAALLGVSPGEVEVLGRDDGSPGLFVKGRASAAGLSISHTRGGALAAVSPRPVGVDLEAWDRPFSERAWQWAFSPEERALAQGRAGEEAWPAPLALWCAKEAAAKSWRLALLNHLAAVRVSRAEWAEGRLEVKGPGGAWAEVELMKDDKMLLALAFGDRYKVIE